MRQNKKKKKEGKKKRNNERKKERKIKFDLFSLDLVWMDFSPG